MWVPRGTFTMEPDRHHPEAAPTHVVELGGFWIDRFEVTYSDFSAFVSTTG
jgi:formylglycine-generating enzyme required for sulfatase activity